MKLALGLRIVSLALCTAGCGTVAVAEAAPPVAPPSLYGAALSEPGAVVGRAAPDFSTVTHDGSAVRISALRGRPVVLFFYSKDEAPGPTREATAFRDAWTELERHGAVVLGISSDTLEEHSAFARRFQLPFRLVSDPEGAIARAYGVGFTYGLLARDTVLVDESGTVKKVYRSVDVARHVDDVLADLGS